MKEISETGYWNGETAHIHHVHSKELSEWICDFLKEDKNKITYDFGVGQVIILKTYKKVDFQT